MVGATSFSVKAAAMRATPHSDRQHAQRERGASLGSLPRPAAERQVESDGGHVGAFQQRHRPAGHREDRAQGAERARGEPHSHSADEPEAQQRLGDQKRILPGHPVERGARDQQPAARREDRQGDAHDHGEQTWHRAGQPGGRREAGEQPGGQAARDHRGERGEGDGGKQHGQGQGIHQEPPVGLVVSGVLDEPLGVGDGHGVDFLVVGHGAVGARLAGSPLGRRRPRRRT